MNVTPRVRLFSQELGRLRRTVPEVNPDGVPERYEVDGRSLYVRPKTYVEPDPVIRRIGDRDLFLGNRHAADPDRTDREFDAVLTVRSEREGTTTHHRPLVDGDEATWERFAAAVDDGRRLFTADGSLLVHCTAGISRSTAVLSTMLAAEERRTFHDALTEVQTVRPQAVPHPRLHELGVYYLAEEGVVPAE